MKFRPAFTLVEILVSIAILTSLAGVTTYACQKFRQNARMATEVSAARNLITAYLSHAADHSGRVISGYQEDASATNLSGESLSSPMNARYPWRLTPNVPKIEGVMLFNGNEAALNSPNSDYLVSVKPNLGLNATLVGGHFGSGSPLPPTERLIQTYGKFYLSHLAESDDPARLIVFASARSGENQAGYFEIRPPNLTRPLWSSAKFKPQASAAEHGYTDFRWNGKAVTAMLAGNIELLTESDLRDMRRWSHQAARVQDPDFLIGPNQP